jgi:hypothetical protein
VSQASIRLARVVVFLTDLVRRRYYGSVQIQFRGGQITVVRWEQTAVDDEGLPVSDPSTVRLVETGRGDAIA